MNERRKVTLKKTRIDNTEEEVGEPEGKQFFLFATQQSN